MPQDFKPGPNSLSLAIEEVLDLVATEIHRLHTDGDACDVEFLGDISRTLRCAVDAELERQEGVSRRRQSDIALIEAQGGLVDRTRMSLLLSLLLAEHGLIVLSDEGVALIADVMLPPDEARRRRIE